MLALGLTQVAFAGEPEDNAAVDAEVEAPPVEEVEAAPVEEEAAPRVNNSAWAEGVSPKDQEVALRLFRKGNALLDMRKFERARDFYLKAVKKWSHPSIHFNLVICEINLGLELEAYANIQEALRYEEGPLGPEVHQQALTYQRLLDGRVARLTVATEHDDIRITLDGDLILDDEGTAERVLLPGTHQVVATKKGHVTFTRKVVLVPGEPTQLDVEMVSLMEATEFKRPMDEWVPWAVTGAGVLVGIAGAGAMLVSDSKSNEYQGEVTRECRDGCWTDESGDEALSGVISEETLALESAAKTWNTVGIATLATGGAAILAGVALVIYNSPQPVRALDRESVARAEFLPAVGPDGGRLDVKWSF